VNIQDIKAKYSFTLEAILDLGSPVSFIQSKFITNYYILEPTSDNERFVGMNQTNIELLGSFQW